VERAEPLGLVNEGSLLTLGERLPLGAQAFGDLGVVHFGVFLRHLPSLASRPDHESVHGALHPVGIVLVVCAMVRLAHALDVVIVRRSGRGAAHDGDNRRSAAAATGAGRQRG